MMSLRLTLTGQGLISFLNINKLLAAWIVTPRYSSGLNECCSPATVGRSITQRARKLSRPVREQSVKECARNEV